jgi:hypothetical protein
LEFRGCWELRDLENSEGIGILIEHFTKDISIKPSLARAASNSFKLDETLYTLSSGGLFSCEVKDLGASSLRNGCQEGRGVPADPSFQEVNYKQQHFLTGENRL